MQRFDCASCKINIPTVLVLFIKDVYHLPENMLTLMEKTIINANEVVIKASICHNIIVVVILKNTAKVDDIISTLCDENMQICKKKCLTTYHLVDLPLL